RMAHGAMPQAGLNPIPRAIAALEAVARIETEELSRHGTHPTLGSPSLTPTIVRAPDVGEPQVNVIPDNAFVAIDVRTIPGQSHADLLARLAAAFESLRQEDADLEGQIELIEDRPWT